MRNHRRSCGWFRTGVPFRHALRTRWYRLPQHLRIFLYLSSVRERPGSQGNPRRNLHRGLTSGSFSPELPLLSHVRCGPPAIRTLWSGGTVLSSSPILLRNTTGCIPSEGHGRSGCLSGRNHRTESRMSGGRRDAPEAAQDLPVLPMQLPVQNLLHGLSLYQVSSPG